MLLDLIHTMETGGTLPSVSLRNAHEEIDWLSLITSSYTLCATKSGHVLCWDMRRDICLSEWDLRSLASSSGECDDSDEAVEFEEHTMYFTVRNR
jgi:hypothetical protein